jgi:hypothetical protein
MTERRWPLIAALAAALLLIGAAWAAGRASAPNTPNSDPANDSSSAVRTINGVPVGVQQSRTGALAAADNYVATASENVVKDPRVYEALVGRVFAPGEQDYALREGKRARTLAPAAVSDYAEGGAAVALVGARRLDTYDGSRAQVTTWLGGASCGAHHGGRLSVGSSLRRTCGGTANAGWSSGCALPGGPRQHPR